MDSGRPVRSRPTRNVPGPLNRSPTSTVRADGVLVVAADADSVAVAVGPPAGSLSGDPQPVRTTDSAATAGARELWVRMGRNPTGQSEGAPDLRRGRLTHLLSCTASRPHAQPTLRSISGWAGQSHCDALATRCS